MGLFNSYRSHVQRVAAALAPVVGGTLGEVTDDRVSYPLAGTRGGRAVRVTLNELHGIFGVGCAVRQLAVGRVTIHQEDSIFAGDAPYVAPALRMRARTDEPALWALLPEPTRATLASMLAPASSSLSLDEAELSMLLGPAGLLARPDADAAILEALDRLLASAAAIEAAWDVEPGTVGSGRSTYVAPARRDEPPPPRPVTGHDPAALRALARPAHDTMLARFAAELVPAFPAANAMREGMTMKGKVVALPPRAPSQWGEDWLKRTITAGEAEHRWYFLREDEPGFARALRAAERYERATGTKLGDAPYEVIARFTGEPMIVVVGGKAEIGHKLALLGALVGDQVFVDATRIVGDDSPFEGERTDGAAQK